MRGFRTTYFFQYLKGTVRRKLRWVKSGINQWLFNSYLAADVFFFKFKGTPSC
jgi:hypothetical protein